MAAPKVFFERHCLAVELQSYLSNAGWTDITKVEEGFQTNATISVPMVSVYFLPSRGKELQMGRSTDQVNKTYSRDIQIDCYMETEGRALAIVDDIADFIDLTTIVIKKPDNTILGSLYNTDIESITTNTLPPLYLDPSIKRWRGIVQASMEAFYNND